ncbi:hypothetical protein RRG08_011303 [Elysia crispata]|uniref:Uncharacterized protein n=1 Tax=Elysia crispata TaxID=231223 RepID=A0AAE0YGR0_9GAST|nr:hypothetical protein RRG08_011303 [Elysia crispata]
MFQNMRANIQSSRLYRAIEKVCNRSLSVSSGLYTGRKKRFVKIPVCLVWAVYRAIKKVWNRSLSRLGCMHGDRKVLEQIPVCLAWAVYRAIEKVWNRSLSVLPGLYTGR